MAGQSGGTLMRRGRVRARLLPWQLICLLLAGQAILLLETGRESALIFAVGSGLALVGLIPALKAVLPPIRRLGQRRP